MPFGVCETKLILPHSSPPITTEQDLVAQPPINMSFSVQSIVNDAVAAIQEVLKTKVLAPRTDAAARTAAWHEAIVEIMGLLVRDRSPYNSNK
jgi:hypothetical protein